MNDLSNNAQGNVIGIIPARMESSRFPGKPLAKIRDKAMIYHVYWRSKMTKMLNDVYIATCDKEIEGYCVENNMKVIMTKDTHERASDRTTEAMLTIEEMTKEKIDIAVMIQGDEPMIYPQMIDESINPLLENKNIQVVNLMFPLKSKEEQEDLNIVKVVVNKKNFALYFSREPIPFRKKGTKEVPMYKQIPIIPFRRDFLIKFNTLSPTPLEKVESVDMLRVLEHGYKVKMILSEFDTHGVDTLDDLRKVERLMKDDPLVEKYARSGHMKS